MQDILGPFGGIVVLWGGNFRQILPVVEKGNREDIVYACITKSSLWQHIHIFYLTQNIWLGQSPEEQAFAQWFLSVGEGTNQQHDGLEYTMTFCDHVKFGGSTTQEGLEDLIDAIYPGSSEPEPRPQASFRERIIFTTHNDTEDKLSHSILAMFLERPIPLQAMTRPMLRMWIQAMLLNTWTL
jgi:hypothetical protein